jgi:hypothetical protein
MIDYFVLPRGLIIHPYEITVPSLLGAGWIRQYQTIASHKNLFES